MVFDDICTDNVVDSKLFFSNSDPDSDPALTLILDPDWDPDLDPDSDPDCL
jgi:hypothetical protein